MDYQQDLYENSDFKKRKSVSLSKKKLKDLRPSSQFAIFTNGTYTNDPTE